ncbi:hypothetical protein D9M72_642830 [compost metagenome]
MIKNAPSMVAPVSRWNSGEPWESEPDPFQHNRLMTNRLASMPTGACQLITLRCRRNIPPARNARLTHSTPRPP